MIQKIGSLCSPPNSDGTLLVMSNHVYVRTYISLVSFKMISMQRYTLIIICGIQQVLMQSAVSFSYISRAHYLMLEFWLLLSYHLTELVSHEITVYSIPAIEREIEKTTTTLFSYTTSKPIQNTHTQMHMTWEQDTGCPALRTGAVGWQTLYCLQYVYITL